MHNPFEYMPRIGHCEQSVIDAGLPLSIDRQQFLSMVPFCNGEYDTGSERTLAAWIRHASRTNQLKLALVGEWRKGE